MGKIAANTHRDDGAGNAPTYEEIVAGASYHFRPLISERWAEPVCLSKDADKGGEVVYAIGRGSAGLVVELRDVYGVSRPTALASLGNHRPMIFEDLDPQILAELTANDPLA